MAIDVLSQELGRSPTVADIADFAGIDEARVVAAIEAGATFRMVPVSPTPGASADDPAIDPPARERPIERLDDALAIQSAIERLSPEDR
jgi:RNA polymerase sigma-B factor